jgi:hypothetical protein
MAPDVAVVGEVRDREGLPQLRAHSGISPTSRRGPAAGLVTPLES